ncbi:MAG: transcriptional repressor [Oscillospiraceae bacterium]|nr:transcriptional repressor [Oscillospiraceae bacterium]
MSKYVTRQRKALLSYLRVRPDELFTAREIAEAMREESISLSAVYRNLSDLEAEGQVRRSTHGGEREIRYQFMAAESCRDCLHLCCTQCGRTFHMSGEGVAALTDAVSKSDNFALDRTETVLYGLCGACRGNAS